MRARSKEQIEDLMAGLQTQIERKRMRARRALNHGAYTLAECYCYELTKLEGQCVDLELDLRELDLK